MKVYLITEDTPRLDPLLAELDRLAVPAEVWHLDETSYDLSEPPPEGLFVNRVAPAAAGSPRLRGLLAWLESYRRRVLNGSGAAALEASRVLQYTALRAAGIPVPRTVSVCGDDPVALRRAARELSGAFAVLSNRPGRGDTRLFTSPAEFDRAVDREELPIDRDGVVLLQEIAGRPGQGSIITRVEFVGGAVQAVRRLKTSGPATPEAGVLGEVPLPEDFDPPVLDRALVFLYSHRVDIGALELAEDARGGLVAIGIGGAAEPTRATSPRTLAASASLIAHELNRVRAASRATGGDATSRRELVRAAV